MTKRILIVDDERLTRLSLADFLTEAGYDVTMADSGEAAVALQRKRFFDVCIVDIRMPGMDGVETLLALHRLAPRSLFIVCTGSPQFTLTPALAALGLTDRRVVYKPVVDMQVFVDLIENFE